MKKIVAAALAITLLFVWALPAQAADFAETTAKAFVLIEAQTGEIIAGENEEEQFPVAGLHKLMSLCVIYSAISDGRISLNDMVTVSPNAAKKGGTRVFLDSGARYTVETLLKPAVMCNANDAITALAEHVSGSEEAFAAEMGRKAAEMGIGGSYVDCTGLGEGNTMSAKDAARAAAALSQYSGFFKYSGIWLDKFVHESGRETEMANNNQLVKTEGFDGMLTGSSPSSGYHLAASFKSGQARFICISIGDKNSADRFQFARAALGYASGAYTVKQLARAGGKVKTVPLTGGKDDEIDIYAREDLTVLVEKGAEQQIKKEIEVDELCAPIADGQTVGKMKVTLPSGATREVELVVKGGYTEVSFGTSMSRILGNWLHGGTGQEKVE